MIIIIASFFCMLFGLFILVKIFIHLDRQRRQKNVENFTMIPSSLPPPPQPPQPPIPSAPPPQPPILQTSMPNELIINRDSIALKNPNIQNIIVEHNEENDQDVTKKSITKQLLKNIFNTAIGAGGNSALAAATALAVAEGTTTTSSSNIV
nr:hypothetical protein [Microctonus hyperodae filamentous virus]